MIGRAGLMKKIILKTHDRQTILITVTFAARPRGRRPKKAEDQKGHNKEMEVNGKANIRGPSLEGQILKAT